MISTSYVRIMLPLFAPILLATLRPTRLPMDTPTVGNTRLDASRRQCCLSGASLAAAAITIIASPSKVWAADAEATRLRAALAKLEELDERWISLITDCNYGEFRRDLLTADNKEALIDAAGSTNKAATTITMCKTTGRNVRAALGTGGADSPLTRIGILLEKPSLVQRVDFDDSEEFQRASEKFQTLLSAADASAFLAANDFSAQTTFKQGETPSTPNLDEARACVKAAKDQLSIIIRLVGA